MIASLNSVPRVIDQTILRLLKGLEMGLRPPRITLRDVPQQVKNQMADDPEKNALLKPFKEFPVEIAQAQRARLRREAAAALKEKVIPAFGKLHEFIERKYLPGAREGIAMCA